MKIDIMTMAILSKSISKVNFHCRFNCFILFFICGISIVKTSFYFTGFSRIQVWAGVTSISADHVTWTWWVQYIYLSLSPPFLWIFRSMLNLMLSLKKIVDFLQEANNSQRVATYFRKNKAVKVPIVFRVGTVHFTKY